MLGDRYDSESEIDSSEFSGENGDAETDDPVEDRGGALSDSDNLVRELIEKTGMVNDCGHLRTAAQLEEALSAWGGREAVASRMPRSGAI